MTAAGVEKLVAHPYADQFPMLDESSLGELAESIAANGQRTPIVVTPDRLILDGRNRAAACAMVGVQPWTQVYEGDDLAEYVIDCNATRRHMSTGARAMATALVLVADGRRDSGRWARGSVTGNGDSSNSAWIKAVQNAGVVLDFKPDLAQQVVSGALALDAAFREADAIRTSAERDKITERERKRREKEQAAADAARDAQYVAHLTVAESKYVALINSGDLTPKAAWAAHLSDTEKQRKADAEIRDGVRRTVTHIAESLRYLEGGPEYADIVLRKFVPHQDEHLADGMRITRARVADVIAFLTRLHEGLPA